MFRVIFESRVGLRPLVQFEATKDRLQIMSRGKVWRHETDGMLRAGSERRRRTGSAASEVIEDHALADVRPAYNRDNKKRIVSHLWQQLAFEQFKPLASSQQRQLQQSALSFQLSNGRMQSSDVFSTGSVGRAHQAEACFKDSAMELRPLPHPVECAAQGRTD